MENYKKAIKNNFEDFKNMMETVGKDFILKYYSDYFYKTDVKEIDIENYEFEEYVDLGNGFNVLFGWAGGDWQYPVLFAIYEGEEGLIMVTPLEGNNFNKKYMIPWGETPDDDLTEEQEEYYEDEEQFKNDADFNEEFDYELAKKWLLENIEVTEQTKTLANKLHIGSIYSDKVGHVKVYLGEVFVNELLYGYKYGLYDRKEMDTITEGGLCKKHLFLDIDREFYERKVKNTPLISQIKSELDGIVVDGFHYLRIDAEKDNSFLSHNFKCRQNSKNLELVDELPSLYLESESIYCEEEQHKLVDNVLIGFYNVFNHIYRADLSDKKGERYEIVYKVNRTGFKELFNIRTCGREKCLLPSDWKDRVFEKYMEVKDEEDEINSKIRKAWDERDYELCKQLGAEVHVQENGASMRPFSLIDES